MDGALKELSDGMESDPALVWQGSAMLKGVDCLPYGQPGRNQIYSEIRRGRMHLWCCETAGSLHGKGLNPVSCGRGEES